MAKCARRIYTEEFKNQMVQLYLNDKSRQEIIREYELTPSTFNKWLTQSQTSDSFKEKDNRSPAKIELLMLKKENQHNVFIGSIRRYVCIVYALESRIPIAKPDGQENNEYYYRLIRQVIRFPFVVPGAFSHEPYYHNVNDISTKHIYQ